MHNVHRRHPCHWVKPSETQGQFASSPREAQRQRLRHKFSKVSICIEEVKFLGHIIRSMCIRPHHKNIEAIQNIPRQQSSKEASSVKCTTSENSFQIYQNSLKNWLKRRNVQVLSRTMTPNMPSSKPNRSWLTSSKSNLPTIVSTYASNIGLCACLAQLDKGQVCPIAFTSMTLTPCDRACAVNEREASACDH